MLVAKSITVEAASKAFAEESTASWKTVSRASDCSRISVGTEVAIFVASSFAVVARLIVQSY